MNPSRRAAALPALPVTAPESVRVLARRAHDGDVDAAVELVRDAVQDTVRVQMRRMLSDRPGQTPARDPITHRTVELSAVHRAQRFRLLAVLAARMCVAVRAHGAQARLTGRRSDLGWAVALHAVVAPVADRVLAEDVRRPHATIRRAPPGASTEQKRLLQLEVFTIDVHEWMRATAAQALTGAGPGAPAALQRRSGAAQQATAVAAAPAAAAGERSAAGPPGGRAAPDGTRP